MKNTQGFVMVLPLVRMANTLLKEQAQRIYNTRMMNTAGIFALVLYIQEPILAKMKKLISILLMKLRESPPLFGIFCSLQKKSGKLQVIKAEVAILQTSAAFRKLMIY